jgi:hypothetical protein
VLPSAYFNIQPSIFGYFFGVLLSTMLPSVPFQLSTKYICWSIYRVTKCLYSFSTKYLLWSKVALLLLFVRAMVFFLCLGTFFSFTQYIEKKKKKNSKNRLIVCKTVVTYPWAKMGVYALLNL